MAETELQHLLARLRHSARLGGPAAEALMPEYVAGPMRPWRAEVRAEDGTVTDERPVAASAGTALEACQRSDTVAVTILGEDGQPLARWDRDRG